MAAIGKAAVRYHLKRSELARDVAATVKLKTAAKTLAYNVAANCWPGWGDEGVVIEASHIDAGLELAILSLRLVEELALGPHQLGNAHWLVGALQLAAGRLDASLLSFGQARDAFASIGGSERAARGRLPRDRVSSGAGSRRSQRSGIGCSDRRAYSGWFEAGEGVRRPAPHRRAHSW